MAARNDGAALVADRAAEREAAVQEALVATKADGAQQLAQIAAGGGVICTHPPFHL